MAFGILGTLRFVYLSRCSSTDESLSDKEDRRLVNVPGTQLLSDRGRIDSVAIDEARDLKRGTGKYSHIILIPQPSDDPRDPYVVLGFSYPFFTHTRQI